MRATALTTTTTTVGSVGGAIVGGNFKSKLF